MAIDTGSTLSKVLSNISESFWFFQFEKQSVSLFPLIFQQLVLHWKRKKCIYIDICLQMYCSRMFERINRFIFMKLSFDTINIWISIWMYKYKGWYGSGVSSPGIILGLPFHWPIHKRIEITIITFSQIHKAIHKSNQTIIQKPFPVLDAISFKC